MPIHTLASIDCTSVKQLRRELVRLDGHGMIFHIASIRCRWLAATAMVSTFQLLLVKSRLCNHTPTVPRFRGLYSGSKVVVWVLGAYLDGDVYSLLSY